MHASALAPDRDDRPREDHFVVLHAVSWDDYRRILQVRGEHSSPRIAYLEGELQIMSPSNSHERIKGLIGRLVEVWCLERGVDFTTYGSWTLEDKRVSRAVEPDECYVFGPRGSAPHPDLAIEVIWTTGGLDKLEIYRELGVREVWIWRRGRLTPSILRGDRYEEASASETLPGIDLGQLGSFIDRPVTSDAIRGYREAVKR